MQKAGCGQNKVGLAIRARESFFALEIARMHCDDRWIILAWIVDSRRIPKWCIGVKKMIRAGRKGYPLFIRGNRGHMNTKRSPCILNRNRHARLPLVKSLPGRLDGADDSLLKMSRILLHNDDGLLEGILFIDLFIELKNNHEISDISVVDECDMPKGKIATRARVSLGSDLQWSVFESIDVSGKLGDKACRQFAFLCNDSCEPSGIVLNVLRAELRQIR